MKPDHPTVGVTHQWETPLHFHHLHHRRSRITAARRQFQDLRHDFETQPFSIPQHSRRGTVEKTKDGGTWTAKVKPQTSLFISLNQNRRDKQPKQHGLKQIYRASKLAVMQTDIFWLFRIKSAYVFYISVYKVQKTHRNKQYGLLHAFWNTREWYRRRSVCK